MVKNILLCVCFTVIFITQSLAQIHAQFRGANRDGVYHESNLLTNWPPDGPALLWSYTQTGNGYGPPAVTNDRIYVTGEIDTTGYLFALNKTGQLLWKSDYGREWVKTFPGSRSTPTVAGNEVYVCSGLGNLCCFDASTGKRKWFVDMLRDLHGEFTYHGHAESPLIDGDQIFLTPGGSDTNVVSLNRFTGKVNWVCKGFGELPGYNSPILIQLPSIKILLTFSAYHLMGIDASNGKMLWHHEQENIPLAERKPGMGDTHSNSAYFENGYIYYVAGDGNCGVKLKLSDDGLQISQHWKNPSIDNFMGGFIMSGNKLYTGSDSKRMLICANASDGQITDSLKIGNGSLALADGLLYYYNQRGEMNLVNVANGKMELVSKFKITAGTKEHFSHPVISEGVLYLRRGNALMAYDIRKK